MKNKILKIIKIHMKELAQIIILLELNKCNMSKLLKKRNTSFN